MIGCVLVFFLPMIDDERQWRGITNFPNLLPAYTRCAWAGGTGASFPDFCDNRQFYVIVFLVNLLYFEEFMIHDSRGFIILKNH